MDSPEDANMLATLANLKLATPQQIETLASLTLSQCRTSAAIAARKEYIRRSDVDDVAQTAAIKALQKIQAWNPAKAAWLTFVSVIAGSAIGDQRRTYKRESILEDAYRKYRETDGY